MAADITVVQGIKILETVDEKDSPFSRIRLDPRREGLSSNPQNEIDIRC